MGLPCACSPPLLVRLKQVLMPDTSMAATMAMVMALPTMDTMDTHMPTITDITMARGLLMPSPLLMLGTCMDTTDTDIDTDMPTTDTMDTLMPMPMVDMDTMPTESNHFVTKILRI